MTFAWQRSSRAGVSTGSPSQARCLGTPPAPFDPEIFRTKIRAWLDLYRKDQEVHELEQAVDDAQAQARTKDNILAMVAHDLRGPLSAVKMSVALVRQQLAAGAEGPKFRESATRHLDLADRTMERMTQMIADLLDTVRIESAELELDIAAHPVEDVVAQAIELLAPLAEQRHIALGAKEARESCAMRCDRDRILQVLSNLLGNAVKFTPPEGRVEVEATCSDGDVVLSVRDTGPGIAPAQLPHVFDKYWQADRTTSRRGFGLGLTIAKEIVLAHGGRIWVESHLGEGSCFFFSVPCAA